MQVDNTTISHAARPPYSISADDAVDPSSFCLLPLHGYSHKRDLTITAPALPLIALHSSLPAELIEKIQSFCSPHDLLALTSVDKAAFATRLYNLSLPHLSLKTIADTEQFLAYCRASQEREAQDLSAEDTQKSRKRLKFEEAKAALLMTPFTKEYLQRVTTLTLTVSDQFTAEQYTLLFNYLSGVTHLTVHSTTSGIDFLCPLLNGAQRLALHHLAVISRVYFGPLIRRDDSFNSYFEKSKDNLPDELWRLATLETLVLENFVDIDNISESIGQLSNLTSLTLESMPKLDYLPDNIGQLNALKSLTLKNLGIQRFPNSLSQLDKLETLVIEDIDLEWIQHEIGELPALKSLTIDHPELKETSPSYEFLFNITQLETLILRGIRDLEVPADGINQLKALKHLELQGRYMDNPMTLPSTLGQLESLETLILENLCIEALPDEIGQCRALKSLHLIDLKNFTGLPATLTQLDKLETLVLEGVLKGSSLLKWKRLEDIGQLPALKSLTIKCEEIYEAESEVQGGLPKTLYRMAQLETLILKGVRRISGRFDGLGQLKALKHLELKNMYIDKKIALTLPRSLGQLEDLETLILERLHIAVLPDEIGQCAALKSLHLINLYKCGGLPTTLAQLDKLETVVIKGRGFETFPEVLTQLPALKSLRLIDSFSLDEVPDKLRAITKVVRVPMFKRKSIKNIF
jgi:Leucine-rich repeat (LRR) protein